MSTTLQRSSLELILLDGVGAKAAPTELLIFPFGTIKTLKGDFLFSKKSAELVKQQWARLGREVGFDYEHDLFSTTTPGKDRDAAGWGRIEIHGEGLWIVGVRWTPEARQKIVSLAFRYLSPAFKTHPKTREILSFENCALTNYPATLDAKPLMLSARPHLLGMPDTTQDTKHSALAKGLMRGCSAMLSAAQAAADSDHEGLKKMGAQLAGTMPEQITALKAAFPDMGEGEEEEDGDKKVAAAAKALTGLEGEAAIGALYALSSRAKVQTQTSAASKDAERMALLERMVKVTRQVHPSDRATFEKLSMDALTSYGKSAPEGLYGPKQTEDIAGAVRLNGQAPEAQELTARRAEAVTAFLAMGMSPEEAAIAAAEVK